MFAITKKTDIVRVEFRVPSDFFVKLDHFAKKEGISRSEFITEACEHYMNQIVTDFNVPVASVQRINQLVEGMTAMERRMFTLENVVDTGLRSIIDLTKGENYLMDEGE